MKVLSIVVNILTIVFFSACSNNSEIQGNYMCKVNNNEIGIFIKNNSIASIKYKGNIHKASWSGNTDKINVITTVHDKEEQITLLKTGKFDMNLEIYSIKVGDKIKEDACLKLKDGSESDMAAYEDIVKKNRIESIKEKEARLAILKRDVSTIQAAIMTDRQSRMLRDSNSAYINSLSSDNKNLFDKILSYPIKAGNSKGKWSRDGDVYDYHIDDNTVIAYQYDNENGTFECFYNCKYLH